MSYFDDNEDRLTWTRRASRRAHAPKHKFSEVCERCGKTGLKWRDTDEGWRLFENERIEHNRLKPHLCTTLDDFEVIE